MVVEVEVAKGRERGGQAGAAEVREGAARDVGKGDGEGVVARGGGGGGLRQMSVAGAAAMVKDILIDRCEGKLR